MGVDGCPMEGCDVVLIAVGCIGFARLDELADEIDIAPLRSDKDVQLLIERRFSLRIVCLLKIEKLQPLARPELPGGERTSGLSPLRIRRSLLTSMARILELELHLPRALSMRLSWVHKERTVETVQLTNPHLPHRLGIGDHCHGHRS